MKVLYTKVFSKDVDKIKDKKLRSVIKSCVIKIEESSEIRDIPNVSKIQGHKDFYRIRIGNYRLGFEIEGSTIWLMRFLKREDIYKYFP